MSIIPRQIAGARSYEGFDLTSLDNRIFALEHSSTAVPNNEFYVKHFGAPSSKLAGRLRNLHDRTTALENSTTAAIDFDVRLARRMPEGSALYDLHHRLTVLGG